ncbi:MAG: type VI secretion system baseplate subunit TssK, partial [Gammaproteobacteria bacterium]
LVSQQHFQQWDFYWERFLKLKLDALHKAESWGWLQFQIDPMGLEHGQLMLSHYSAIFPSGRVVASTNFEKESTLFINLENLENKTNGVDVYLKLPYGLQVQGINGYEVRNAVINYYCEYRTVEDIYDSARKSEILLGVFMPSLIAVPVDTLEKGKQEKDKNAEYLLLCRLKNLGTQKFSIDFSEKIPVFLDILNNSELVSKIKILQEKIHWIWRLDFSELKDLEILRRIKYYEQCLEEASKIGIHPRSFHQLLLKFYLDVLDPKYLNQKKYPSYEHTDQKSTFELLEQVLKALEDLSQPKHRSYFFQNNTVEVSVEDLLKPWVLKINSNSSYGLGLDWQTAFSKEIKFASAADINALVSSALPGMNMIPLKKTKYKLADEEYCFLILQEGMYWKNIVNSKKASVFLPHKFIHFNLELIIVNEDQGK